MKFTVRSSHVPALLVPYIATGTNRSTRVLGDQEKTADSHSFSILALASTRVLAVFFDTHPPTPVVRGVGVHCCEYPRTVFLPLLLFRRSAPLRRAYTPICLRQENTTGHVPKEHLLRPRCSRERESAIPTDRRSKGQNEGHVLSSRTRFF